MVRSALSLRGWSLFGLVLEPVGELLERRAQVGDRFEDEAREWPGVLLAHRESCRWALIFERVGALAGEQPERHPASEHDPVGLIERNDLDWERSARVGLDGDRELSSRPSTFVTPESQAGHAVMSLSTRQSSSGVAWIVLVAW